LLENVMMEEWLNTPQPWAAEGGAWQWMANAMWSQLTGNLVSQQMEQQNTPSLQQV
jgi:hypothetical protein